MKVGRTQLLELELAESQAADAFMALKTTRSHCSECGSVKPFAPKKQADYQAAKQALAAARKRHRRAREGLSPDG